MRVVHVLGDARGGGVAYAQLLSQHVVANGGEASLLLPEALPDGHARRSAAIVRAGRGAVLHVHGTRAGLWALPALAAGPSVLTFHGLHPLRRAGGRAYRTTARAAVLAMTAAATEVICVAQTEADDLARARFGAPAGVVIRNAVPEQPLVSAEERAQARAKLKLDENDRVVLFLSRMEAAKDPLTAMRVAALLPSPWVTLVAGDGPMAAETLRAAPANARLMGYVDDPRSCLAASDVVLSTSLWEGLPLTVLDAMWAGVPVVATRVPGNVEALGPTGSYAEPGRSDDLAAAVVALADPEARDAQVTAARERVRTFSLTAMLSATADVYARVAR